MKAKKIYKIVALVLLFIALFIILGISFYAYIVVKDQKLDKSVLENKMIETVKILDCNGSELEYFSSLKQFVPYDKINKNVINAFVSVEDKRFFSHNGLDLKRIIGATINNAKAGSFKEGGSTITQQLVKNALLSNEKTINRKLKEAKLSIELERNYSKEEIIAMYLNTIYFGHSLYGIESASKRLFNKEPKDLSISESAILAGIVKNPLKNSPLNSVENAINRRNLILKLMYEQKYITTKEYSLALEESYTPPTIDSLKNESNSSYTEMVINEASLILNVNESEVLSNGYTIHTFFNKNEQNLLTKTYDAQSLSISNGHKTIMLLDNSTGGITAYISSVGYSPYNYRRCPASTLKPIISYAPALEKGIIVPSSPILDEKTDFDGYSPKNYNDKYLGWTNVNDSLINSSNVCSVKLLKEVGLNNSFELAKDFGISLSPKDGPATALGGTTNGQTIVDILSAYSTIANGGIRKNIGAIKAIYDKNGKRVYCHQENGKRVISEETSYFLTKMLIDCSKNGTAKKLGTLPFEIASKTGTNGNADGNYDAWNVSYTTDYTLACWYGSNDYKKPLPLSVSGGSYPTICARQIWSELPLNNKFSTPNSIKTVQIDSFSLENFHTLTLSNENTPIELTKTIEISNKIRLNESHYFDESIPDDFEVMIGDGEIIIKYTPNNKFNYKIEDSKGNIIYEHKKGLDFVEITLPKPNTNLELYTLVAYVDETIMVKRSHPALVITI